ncbi:hypothetical protein PUR57_13450 [Streptomyces sp. JV176]|uniref:hypothetical protein n=1 Tax=Streptomyces sp. JV176 TaxID=858630 RepID=UPI002E78D4AF|nr:hypothetical protein [Streptomyces sp. JV176]MEE1799666.1 hypothetical protein [Streptomyces sp. JV176]
MKVGIEVEVEEHNPAQTGFVPQAKGWNVELVRDYERQLHTAESRAYWAMTAMIWLRLTGAAAPMSDHPAHQQILAVFATAEGPAGVRGDGPYGRTQQDQQHPAETQAACRTRDPDRDRPPATSPLASAEGRLPAAVMRGRGE